MRVLLRVGGGSSDDVESLHRWLRGENAVAAHGSLSWAHDDDPTQMGTLVDVLTLILGSGLSASQLAVSLMEWRRSRPGNPAVTITCTSPDGATVRIDAATPETLVAAVRALEQR
jgi:hypothetical protein